GRLRALVALGDLEGALDRGALRRDRDHVAVADLLQEERAVGDTDPGRRLHRARAQPVVDREQTNDDEQPARVEAEARAARRRRAVPRGRRRRPWRRLRAHVTAMLPSLGEATQRDDELAELPPARRQAVLDPRRAGVDHRALEHARGLELVEAL